MAWNECDIVLSLCYVILSRLFQPKKLMAAYGMQWGAIAYSEIAVTTDGRCRDMAAGRITASGTLSRSSLTFSENRQPVAWQLSL